MRAPRLLLLLLAALVPAQAGPAFAGWLDAPTPTPTPGASSPASSPTPTPAPTSTLAWPSASPTLFPEATPIPVSKPIGAPAGALPAGAPSASALPGALRVVSAAPAERGRLLVAGGVEFFSQKGFIRDGRNHRRTASSLAFGYALSDGFAVAATLLGATNHDSSTNPFFIAAIGDVDAEARATFVAMDNGSMRISAGARAGVKLMQGSSPGSRVGDAASPYARALFTVEGGPARVSLDGGYLVDRSKNLIDTAFVPDAGQRYAYGISDYNAVVGGLALDFPRAAIGPFLETTVRADLGGPGDPAVIATGGVKIAPRRSRLSFVAAADAGVLGTTLEKGRLRAPDWNVVGGMSYAFGEASAPGRKPPKRIPLPLPLPGGRVRGRVLAVGTGVPIAAAAIDLGEGRNALTAGNGVFEFPDVPKGAVTIAVKHPSYDGASRTAVVTEGQVTNLLFHLSPIAAATPIVEATPVATATPAATPVAKATPTPKGGTPKATGSRKLTCTILGATGKPMTSASVIVVGPDGTKRSTLVDKKGSFTMELPPGEYELAVSAIGYPTQSKKITLDPGKKKPFITSMKLAKAGTPKTR